MGAYGERSEEFDEAGIRIVALTAESEPEARSMAEDEGVFFPVLHSVDLDRVEEGLGLWVRRGGGRNFFEPAQIILRPDGTVAQACYQSGPVGRLKAGDALERVEVLRKRG